MTRLSRRMGRACGKFVRDVRPKLRIARCESLPWNSQPHLCLHRHKPCKHPQNSRCRNKDNKYPQIQLNFGPMIAPPPLAVYNFCCHDARRIGRKVQIGGTSPIISGVCRVEQPNGGRLTAQLLRSRYSSGVEEAVCPILC